LKKLLNRPEAQASEDQLSELNSTASQNSPIQGDYQGPLLISARLSGTGDHDNKNAIPQFQSELSDRID